MFTEEREDPLHHKHTRKNIEKPIGTSDDIDFSREEIQHAIESFSD
jgi:hypothetical protein